MPTIDLTLFDSIEARALAMGYAHRRHLAASAPVLPVRELSDRVVAVRELLASDCTALAKRGLVDGLRLNDLKGPFGYKNQAFDVLTLVAMLRGNWQNIQGEAAYLLRSLPASPVGCTACAVKSAKTPRRH